MSGSNGKIILLVEDEAILAMHEKRALENYGYTVKTVSSGMQAVEAARASSDIDLILMDINLGSGMDGTEAAELILEDRDVPIVFVSSHREREIVEKTERITSYGYVVKNSSITVLDASIKMALKLFDANKKVLETDSKQHTMIANISDVIGIIGADGIMKYESPNIEKWFGWKPEDLVGKEGWMTSHPDDRERLQDAFSALLAQEGATATVEFRYRCRDGCYKPAELFATNLVNDPGIRGVLLNYRDISERKKAEDAVMDSEEKFRALFEKGPIGVAYHEMVYDEAGRAVDYRFLDANSSYRELTGVDPRYKLVTEAFPGIEKDPFDWIGVFGNVALTGRQVRFEQYLQFNKRWYDCVGYQFKPGHFVAAFMEITERKNAELALQHKNEEYEALNEELRSSMEELLTSSDKIRESEERYDTFINVVKDMVFIKDSQLRYVVVNDAMTQFLHKTKEEIIGRTDRDLADGRMIPSSRVSDRQALESGSPLFVKEFLGDRYCETTKFPLQLSGNRKGVGGIIRDITERQHAEEALRKSQDHFRLMLNVAAEIIISLDEHGNILLLNESGHTILGYASQELAGRNWIDTCLPPELRDDMRNYFRQLQSDDAMTLTTRENDVLTRSGERRSILWHNALLKDRDGSFIAVFSSGEDITERKRTEAALRTSEERLKFALDVSGLGEWELNLKTNAVHRNARWAEMLGYSLAEIDERFDQGIELQHPDDREAVRKAVEDYYEGRADSFKVIYRMRMKDGAYKWIQDCGKIMEHDAAGNPVRVCGTHADVDEQKKAEDAIRREQRRLQNVLSGTKAGTWEWNILTGEAEIDEASAALLGYTLDEFRPAIFEAWMQLKHPDDMKESNDLLMRHVRGLSEYYSFDSRMKHKDGRWIWVQGRGKISEWDESGKPLRIFGTHIDITERKLNEYALKESQERLQFALEGSELGEWDWNLKTNTITRNERWAGMLGYTLAEINADLQQGIDLQHPDDREEAWLAIQDHLAGKTASYTIEYRMLTCSGTYKWIHDCGKIMERDGQGNPVRLCGTHADIDEKKKAEERIQALLTEKELILKEVHHRIKNNMNTVTSMLSLQAGTVAETSAAIALQDAGNRIQCMSLLYDKLFGSATYTRCSIKEYLTSLIDEILGNFPEARSVHVDTNFQEDILLDVKLLQPLGIIMNELLTNTMKHGMKGKEDGQISIAAVNVDGHVTVSVQDNGVGVPDSISFENSTGFGLQLVHALTEQLHGTIHIQRGHGTRIVLEFLQ